MAKDKVRIIKSDGTPNKFTSRTQAERHVGKGRAVYLTEAKDSIKFIKDISKFVPKIVIEESLFNFTPIRQIGNSHRSYRTKNAPRVHRSPEELHWRESILLRDEYTCVWCGSKENLEADHIKPKFLYPDLKFDIENGRTLCFSCHTKTETYGSKVRRLVSVDVESLDT